VSANYDPKQRFEIEVSDVEYLRHGSEGFLARIYRPKGDGPFPILLDAHGGQWHLNDRTGNRRVCQDLAASGMLVVALDFRMAPEYTYPAAIQDVSYGVRWWKATAPAYGGDASKIGLFGSSSGGHIVELIGLRPHDPLYAALPLSDHPDVDATVDYLMVRAPISDPLARYGFAERTGRNDILDATKNFFQPWETVFEGNPQKILERRDFELLPPILIIQGSADENIDWNIQKHFADTYREAGGESRFELFDGMEHQFVQRDCPEASRAIDIARSFACEALGTGQ
jgi:acetyl esterase/lipase